MKKLNFFHILLYLLISIISNQETGKYKYYFYIREYRDYIITSIKIGDSKTINSPTLINENGYEYGPYYLDKLELFFETCREGSNGIHKDYHITFCVRIYEEDNLIFVNCDPVTISYGSMNYNIEDSFEYYGITAYKFIGSGTYGGCVKLSFAIINNKYIRDSKQPGDILDLESYLDLQKFKDDRFKDLNNYSFQLREDSSIILLENEIPIYKFQTFPITTKLYFINSNILYNTEKEIKLTLFLNNPEYVIEYDLYFGFCYEKCNTCNDFRDQKCTSCKNGYYRKYDDLIYCYSIEDKERNFNNYYLNETDNTFYKCNSHCLTCNNGGTDENTNCLLCKDNNYFVDGTNQCSTNNINGYYRNDSLRKYMKCYESCKTCNKEGNVNNHNCQSCKDGFVYMDGTNNCYDKNIIIDYYYFNQNKFVQCNNKCINCENNPNYCSSCISGYYLLDNICETMDTILNKGYILELNEDNNYIVKKCYSTCKKCNRIGDENNHKCTECIDGTYKIIIDDNYREEFTCLNHIPDGYIRKENNAYRKCYSNCLQCSDIGNDLENKCTVCKSGFEMIQIELNDRNFNCMNENDIPSNYYKDIYDNKIVYRKCYERCKKCERRGDNNDHKCTECSNGYYLLENTQFCYQSINDLPSINYFLDIENNIFKKCHDNCKKCEKLGNNDENYCTECKEGFYLIENDNKGNCYNTFPDINYYFDNNMYKKCYRTCKTCTQGFEIIDNKIKHNCFTCIENSFKLENDEFPNNCYLISELGDNYHQIDDNNINKCDISCINDNQNIPDEQFYNIIDYIDNEMEKISTGSNSNLDLSNNYEFKGINGKIVTLSSSLYDDEIDLKECRRKLISQSIVNLFLVKLKMLRGTYTQFEYEVYDTNGMKKNLNICNGDKAEITSDLINLSSEQIQKLKADYEQINLGLNNNNDANNNQNTGNNNNNNQNIGNNYNNHNNQNIGNNNNNYQNIGNNNYNNYNNNNNYNQIIDICKTVDKELCNSCKPYSINNLDLIIDDRIKIYGNKSSNSRNLNEIQLCEPGCILKSINFNTQKIKCECDVKTQIIIERIYPSSRILSDNEDFSSNINTVFSSFSCFSNIFSLKNLKNNIGLYIMSIIGFISILNLILFIIFGWDNILKNLHSLEELNINITSFSKVNNPPKKKVEQDLIISTNKKNNNYINKSEEKKDENINKDETKMSQINEENDIQIPIKKNKEHHHLTLIDKNDKKEKNKRNIKELYLNEGESSIRYLNDPNKENILNQLNNSIEKNNIIYKGNKDELFFFKGFNEIYQERKNIKFHHYFFYLCKNYLTLFYIFSISALLIGSKLPYVTLFLLKISLHFLYNVLMIDDKMIHNIFISNGKYNYFSNIPKILLASFLVILTILCIRFLFFKTIENLIKMSNLKVNDKGKSIIKTRIYIFLIMSFILIFIILFIIGDFCVIFSNTQKYLFINILISIIIDIIFHIIINIILSAIMINAIMNKKTDIYDCINCLQLI